MPDRGMLLWQQMRFNANGIEALLEVREHPEWHPSQDALSDYLHWELRHVCAPVTLMVRASANHFSSWRSLVDPG